VRAPITPPASLYSSPANSPIRPYSQHHFKIFPATVLLWGTWRRTLNSELNDLSVSADPTFRVFNIIIHSGGSDFKLEIPYDSVSQIHYTGESIEGSTSAISNLSAPQPHITGSPTEDMISINLISPPKFYMLVDAALNTLPSPMYSHHSGNSGIHRKEWLQCSDFTENAQATKVLRFTIHSPGKMGLVPAMASAVTLDAHLLSVTIGILSNSGVGSFDMHGNNSIINNNSNNNSNNTAATAALHAVQLNMNMNMDMGMHMGLAPFNLNGMNLTGVDLGLGQGNQMLMRNLAVAGTDPSAGGSPMMLPNAMGGAGGTMHGLNSFNLNGRSPLGLGESDAGPNASGIDTSTFFAVV
jgi:hypothetical protein